MIIFIFCLFATGSLLQLSAICFLFLQYDSINTDVLYYLRDSTFKQLCNTYTTNITDVSTQTDIDLRFNTPLSLSPSPSPLFTSSSFLDIPDLIKIDDFDEEDENIDEKENKEKGEGNNLLPLPPPPPSIPQIKQPNEFVFIPPSTSTTSTELILPNFDKSTSSLPLPPEREEFILESLKNIPLPQELSDNTNTIRNTNTLRSPFTASNDYGYNFWGEETTNSHIQIPTPISAIDRDTNKRRHIHINNVDASSKINAFVKYVNR